MTRTSWVDAFASIDGAEDLVAGCIRPVRLGEVHEALDWPDADPVDVVAYVRRLEQVLIDTCTDLGLSTTRIEGRSGVWVRGGV